jgi:hypothetical protein
VKLLLSLFYSLLLAMLAAGGHWVIFYFVNSDMWLWFLTFLFFIPSCFYFSIKVNSKWYFRILLLIIILILVQVLTDLAIIKILNGSISETYDFMYFMKPALIPTIILSVIPLFIGHRKREKESDILDDAF